jgi:hypothetical protein
MKSEEVDRILDKYLAEQASVEEVKLVEAWYESFETNPGIVEQLSKEEIEQSMNKGFMRIKKGLESEE